MSPRWNSPLSMPSCANLAADDLVINKKVSKPIKGKKKVLGLKSGPQGGRAMGCDLHRYCQ